MSPIVFKWFPINIQIFYSLKWQSFLCVWFSWITNLAIFKFTLLVFNYNFGTFQVLMVNILFWLNLTWDFFRLVFVKFFYCLFLKRSKHQIISCTSKVQCQFKRNRYSIFTRQFRKFLRQSIMFSVFTACIASCQMGLRKPGWGVFSYKRLMGMCCWMLSHFQ